MSAEEVVPNGVGAWVRRPTPLGCGPYRRHSHGRAAVPNPESFPWRAPLIAPTPGPPKRGPTRRSESAGSGWIAALAIDPHPGSTYDSSQAMVRIGRSNAMSLQLPPPLTS